MLGLTLDKVLLVAILAGVLIGPTRLPAYTRQFAGMVRSFRDFLEVTRARAEEDLHLTREEWEALDPRRYDPRHVVREAFTRPAHTEYVEEPVEEAPDPRIAEAADIRPGQKYLVSGPAAHPIRILIASLPPDDPRRIAADVELPTATVTE